MSYAHTTELTDFDDKGNARKTAGGSGNVVTFSYEDRLGEGGTIVKREMVSIRAPGDKLSEFCGKVTDEIRKQYPREYEAFRRGAEYTGEGTPIQTWTEIGQPARRELMFMGFNTIEQLAEASDGQCGGLSNGNVLRAKARIFVKKNTVEVDVAAENKELKATMATMMERMEKLEAARVLPESTPSDGAPVPRKRGRPAKASDAV